MISVILDNGHGSDTAGKCSPDNRLSEDKYCREIVRRISAKLEDEGIPYHVLVPEEEDISLAERCRRANTYHIEQCGEGNDTILISVHNNAAGKGGKWCTASGWTAWVCEKASANSIKLAQLLYAECEKLKLAGNRYVPNEKYWSANFYLLKHTMMPAVLTENLFQDNKEEVDWMLTEEGMDTLATLHVEGIKAYINEQNSK